MFFLFSWADFGSMSGLEEIIFEHRNRQYGAYDLRKKANKYTAWGLIISILFIALTSIGLFVVFNSELFFPEHYPQNIGVETMQMSDLQDLLFPEPPKAMEKASTDIVKPEIADSTYEEKKKVEPKKNAAGNDSITKKGAETTEEGKGSMHGDSVFLQVDKVPEFIGGKEELTKFLRMNLIETAKKCKTRIRVMVQFLVTKTGDVTDVSVVAGVNPEVNADVIKVISRLPRMNPAQQRGHPVSCRCKLLVDFTY